MRLASMQRLLTLTAALALIVWWRWSTAADVALPVQLLGACLLVVPHAPVLAVEFALLHWVDAGPAVRRPTWAQVARAWAQETLNGLAVFAWRQPWREYAVPDRWPEAADRRGVLFVHGFVCNRALWAPWMRWLQHHDVPCAAVNLEPVFGTIDGHAATLQAAYDRLCRHGTPPPLIVAHSMGGLAVRAWLATPGAPTGLEVVTIGTPHAGTWLARFGLGRNARQMRQGSPWLSELERREAQQANISAAPPTRWTCFYGHADNIVFPARTATRSGPWAINHHVPATGHVMLAFHPAVRAWVGRRLGLTRWPSRPTGH